MLIRRLILSAMIVAISAMVATFMAFRAQDDKPVAAVKEPVVPETPYDHGFQKGYDAFLKQTGRYVPRPGRVASYTSSYSDDDEEVVKGYVDGYHRATELDQCPRDAH